MCVNAPPNHPTRYPDLFRVSRGKYETYDRERHGNVPFVDPQVKAPVRIRRSQKTRAQVEELIANFEGSLLVFGKAVPFGRVGQWSLHSETIGLRRSLGSVAAATESHEFRGLLRQTLRSWGIGIRGSRQVSESVFHEGLREFQKSFEDIETEQIEDPMRAVEDLTEKVWHLVRDLPVVESKAKIVAGTKTVHHLLPDLVPPMDRAWTGKFFRWSVADPQNNQEAIFKEAFGAFCGIAQVVRPSRFVGSGWNTSQSKVLDNGLIGYLRGQDDWRMPGV